MLENLKMYQMLEKIQMRKYSFKFRNIRILWKITLKDPSNSATYRNNNLLAVLSTDFSRTRVFVSGFIGVKLIVPKCSEIGLDLSLLDRSFFFSRLSVPYRPVSPLSERVSSASSGPPSGAVGNPGGRHFRGFSKIYGLATFLEKNKYLTVRGNWFGTVRVGSRYSADRSIGLSWPVPPTSVTVPRYSRFSQRQYFTQIFTVFST